MKRSLALVPLLGLGIASAFAFAPHDSQATSTAALSPRTIGFQFESEGDAIHGSLRTEEGGQLEFDAAVISDHVVQVELRTSTVRSSFRADFELGELLIDGNAETLTASDWRAINEAYATLGTAENADANAIAVLYTHRALGMMAESLPGFEWDSWDAKLPVLDEAAPSFFEDEVFMAAADGDEEESDTLEVLRRADSGGVEGVTPRLDPSVLAAYPGLPNIADCGGKFLDDARDGKIECVEYGKFYCIEFDMFMSKEVDVEAIAPVIPPWWSRAKARNMKTPEPGLTSGAYKCSGRCGPGCDAPPKLIGGGGGWGVGCLIHDDCTYESTGGKDLSKVWTDDLHNIQTNPSCGMEMRMAADDHFMPPAMCPGSKTVGGSGKWYRYAPPRVIPKHWKKFKNTVSKSKTPFVGTFDVEKPKSSTGGGGPPKPGGLCKKPGTPGCDMH